MSVKSERLLKIYARLKRGPVTIETIKDWASRNNIRISERTFYRDLNELETSLVLPGESIVVSVGEKNRKTWKIEYTAGHATLDGYDINSYLMFKNFMPMPVVLSRKKSLDKIEKIFYKNHSKSRFEDFATAADLQVTSSHFYELNEPVIYEKIIEDCIWSIQNKREMKILKTKYDHTSLARSVTSPMKFLPVLLLYHRGVVHLCGFVKELDKFCIYALEQIKKYKLTNNMFDPEPYRIRLEQEMTLRFGVTENMDHHIYDIEIEFSEMSGFFVKNHSWHPGQQFTRLSNGNFLMKFRCGINRELVGWIFQWLSNAKVRKPEILRDLVAGKASEILDMYVSDRQLVSVNSFKAP